MPNWKKLIVSGSDASLNSLSTISSVCASGNVRGEVVCATSCFVGNFCGNATTATTATSATTAGNSNCLNSAPQGCYVMTCGDQTITGLKTFNNATDGNNYISLTTGGNSRLTIGTAGSGAHVLMRTGNSVDLRMGVNANDHLVIKSTGNVGIGTTTPQSILDVVTPVNGFASFANQMSPGSFSGIHFGYRENNSSYRKSAIVFERTDLCSNNAQGKVHILNGPLAGAGSATLSDAKLTINEIGNVGIGTTSPAVRLDYGASTDHAFHLYTSGVDYYGINMVQYDSESYSTNIFSGNGGQIKFRTATGTSTQTTRMTIKPDGAVGIGTTTPASNLHVVGSARVVVNSGAGGDTLLGAINGVSNGYRIQADSSNNITYSWNTGTNATAMFITCNGNVGIGTVSPTEILHLNNPTSNAAFIRFQNTGGSGVYLGGRSEVMEMYTCGTEKMRITPGGTLLVGDTVNPFEPAWLGTAVLGKTGYDKVIIGSLNSSYCGATIGGHNSALTAWCNLNIVGGDIIFRHQESERVRIVGSSGNVGIGTSNPDSPLEICSTANTNTFTITADGANEQFRIRRSSNTNEQLLIGFHSDDYGFIQTVEQNVDYRPLVLNRDGGNVGIGFTAPTSKLYIQGGSANWNETTPGTSVGTIHLDPGADTDNIGNAITFGASDSSNGETAQAGIYVRSDGTYGTKMYIATTDGYGDGSKTRLMINSNGNVGIGTNSPGARLTVTGNGTGTILGGDPGVTDYAGISLNGTLSISDYNILSSVGDKNLYINRPTGADIRFRITNCEQVIITAAGNVGIGTTAPAYKLDVNAGGGAGAGMNLQGSADVRYHVFSSATTEWVGYELRSSNENVFAGGMFRNNADNNRVSLYSKTAEVISITDTCNVGIGTTNPGCTLSVVGSICSSDHIRASTICATSCFVGNFCGTVTNSNQLGGQDNNAFIRVLSGGNEANIDTYVDNGLRVVTYTGFQKHMLSWNLGGSPGTIQQEFDFNPPERGWRIRGKTDNNTWDPWGYVVMATANQGNISGTVLHSGNYNCYAPTLTGTGASGTWGINITGAAGSATTAGNSNCLGSAPQSSYVMTCGNQTVAGVKTFSSCLIVSGSSTTLLSSGSTVLDIQGSQGQLFSVTDCLTGTLMSVNDISGLPILEVSSDDKVVMGTFGANTLVVTGSRVGIGTCIPGTKLEVNGAIRGGCFSAGATNTGEAWFGRASDRTLGTYTLQLGGTSASNTSLEIVDRAWTKVIALISGEAPGSSFIVNSGGNVGIGTTDPSSKLEVNGNIKLSSTVGQTATPSNIWLGNDYSDGVTRDKLKIYLYNDGVEKYGFGVGSSGDVQYHSNTTHDFYINNGHAVRVNSTGVGIGTTSPSSKVHISATGTPPSGVGTLPTNTLLTLDNGDNNNFITIRNRTDTGLYGGILFQDNNVGGYIAFKTYVGSGANDGTNGDYMVYGTYTDHIFQAGSSETVDGKTEIMRIKGTGNVGIGTCNPIFPLSVNGGIQALGAGNDSPATGNIIYIGDGSAGSVLRHTATGRAFAIDTYSSSNVWTERLRILRDGNVGIGTTDPGVKLDINLGAGSGTGGTPALRIRGLSDYPSLEMGIQGNYDGFIRTYGNDLHLYSGHWRSVGDTATEDHKLFFYTSQAGSTNWASPKMTLNAAGNLGIGTSDPGNKLQIGAGGGGYGGNDFVIGNGTQVMAIYQSSIATNFYTNTRFAFLNSGGGDGFVGIGTSTPGCTLSVVGSICSSDHIRASTICATSCFVGNFCGNATTATNLSTNRTNWATNGTITAVVGQLAWNNYSNNHTIFDASAGTAPDGTSVNNTNSQVVWTGTYPTLMGWNGTNTYGVRVDSARNADTFDGAASARFLIGDSGCRRGVNVITDWNQTTYQDAAFLSSENNSTNSPSTDFIYGVQTSFHRGGPDYRTQFVTSLYGDNVYWLRQRRDTAGWSSWVNVVHSGNVSSYTAGNSNCLGGTPAACFVRTCGNQTVEGVKTFTSCLAADGIVSINGSSPIVKSGTSTNMRIQIFDSDQNEYNAICLVTIAGIGQEGQGYISFNAPGNAVVACMRSDSDGGFAVLNNITSGGNTKVCKALGVGTATPSATAGRIDASNDIVAFSSDRRLKENIQTLQCPLQSVKNLSGFSYNWNVTANQLAGYDMSQKYVGLYAQEVQSVLPQAVKLAPFDNDGNDNSISGCNYLTVQYEKLVPLLVEAIKEQQCQIEELRNELYTRKNGK